MVSRVALVVLCARAAAFVAPRARVGTFDPIGLCGEAARTAPLAPTAAARHAAFPAALAAAAVFAPDAAVAKGGEFGLAEGRIISLAHPVMMGVCFATSLYAGYTGLQWRRLREVGTELQEAKAVAKSATAKYEAAVEAAGEEAVPPSPALLASSTEAASAVAQLSTQRSDLAGGNFRDTHYTMGTVLLGIGIPFALEGPVNTYMRAGKLFPGDHVYAGVAICSLWAFAAALVPQMQKGKDWARYGHIGANAITVAMFAYYQIPTGLAIAEKVIANTKFP